MKVSLSNSLLKTREVNGYKLSDEALGQLIQKLPGTKVFLGDNFRDNNFATVNNMVGVVDNVDNENIIIETDHYQGVVAKLDFTAIIDGLSITEICEVISVGIAV